MILSVSKCLVSPILATGGNSALFVGARLPKLLSTLGESPLDPLPLGIEDLLQLFLDVVEDRA